MDGIGAYYAVVLHSSELRGQLIRRPDQVQRTWWPAALRTLVRPLRRGLAGALRALALRLDEHVPAAVELSPAR
jgi:hypothetical protein